MTAPGPPRPRLRPLLPHVDVHAGPASAHLGFAPPRRPDPTSLVFSALADPTRRAILELLAGFGAATATQLTGRFPVTRQAITKHLAALGDAGLVRSERVGREQRFHVDASALATAREWMASIELGPEPG